jgi:hypothetical protein
MSGSDTPTRPLTFDRLPEFRNKSEAISAFLRDQLTAHLETLRPILSAERLFGKSAGGKADAPLADRALAQLQQSYRSFAGPPFDLPAEFDPYWLTLVGNRVALYPWEYTHEASDGRQTRSISMTSPVRWVMSFSSGYTLSQLRQAILTKGERRPEHVRQFVVNALVAQLLVTHTPGLAALFADLRYDVQTHPAPDLPKLPLTTMTSGLPSFRPSDDLIFGATSFSGVPAFVELIDIDAIEGLEDPLKARLRERLR